MATKLCHDCWSSCEGDLLHDDELLGRVPVVASNFYVDFYVGLYQRSQNSNQRSTQQGKEALKNERATSPPAQIFHGRNSTGFYSVEFNPWGMNLEDDRCI